MERAVTTNEQGENHSRALPVIYRLSLVHSFALQLWCLDYFCQSVVLHSFILSIPQCQSHFHQQLPEVPSVAKSRSNNRIIWQWYPDGNMVTVSTSVFFFLSIFWCFVYSLRRMACMHLHSLIWCGCSWAYIVSCGGTIMYWILYVHVHIHRSNQLLSTWGTEKL